jgi:hypothetical protein
MSNERYPADLVVTREDFLASGSGNILAEIDQVSYFAIYQAFSGAAGAAMDQGRLAHGKVLWLLADACSMTLSPASRNEPFKPYAVLRDRRSAIPDDLSETDIAFFAQCIDVAEDIRLKARLADLVWLKGKPRDVGVALTAIDAYRSIPLGKDHWIQDGRECWARAISLAKMLRGGAGDRLAQIEGAIFDAFFGASKAEGCLALWLANLLKSNGLGRDRQGDVASRLEALAREIDSDGDLERARKHFSAAADWWRAVPDATKTAEMTAAVAEGWVKEAVKRVSSENPSHIVAASFYENAIQTYRTIPRGERAAYRVEERLAELQTDLNAAGEKALGEMTAVQTPGIDISQMIEYARNAVTQKAVPEALYAFANLYPGVNPEGLRKLALESMHQFPLQSLIAATMMSRDGRVIAKRPAMSLGGAATEDDEAAIRAKMIQDYGVEVSLVVQGEIWPALEVLLAEHRLREIDFVELASNSPIVPKGRAGLFGKALFAGYDRDFATALHFLIPQIEHLVRVHLKQAGAQTANLDKDGIQNENGMGTLMVLPEAEKLFGPDLAFELRSLFCDQFGPNLRNVWAHGQLDEEGCYSHFAIYAWWLALRLTVNAWWNEGRGVAGSQNPPEGQ